nr:hypothetical protein [Paracoccus saliphilus]
MTKHQPQIIEAKIVDESICEMILGFEGLTEDNLRLEFELPIEGTPVQFDAVTWYGSGASAVAFFEEHRESIMAVVNESINNTAANHY